MRGRGSPRKIAPLFPVPHRFQIQSSTRLAPLHGHDHSRRRHSCDRTLSRSRSYALAPQGTVEPRHTPSHDNTNHQQKTKMKTTTEKQKKLKPLDSPNWVSESSVQSATKQNDPGELSLPKDPFGPIKPSPNPSPQPKEPFRPPVLRPGVPNVPTIPGQIPKIPLRPDEP